MTDSQGSVGGSYDVTHQARNPRTFIGKVLLGYILIAAIFTPLIIATWADIGWKSLLIFPVFGQM